MKTGLLSFRQTNLRRVLLVTALLIVALLPARQLGAADISGPYADQVQQMYVAYYGRPGDPMGVEYWAGRLAQFGGNWITDLVNAFGTSEEYSGRFGDLDSSTLIDNLYQQLFDRTAEAAGKAFYVDLLNGINESGMNPDFRTSTLAEIALDIANGARNDDLTLLTRKIEMSEYFTGRIDASDRGYFYDDIPKAQDVLAQVSMDDDWFAKGQQVTEYFLGTAPPDSFDYVGFTDLHPPGWVAGKSFYRKIQVTNDGVYVEFTTESNSSDRFSTIAKYQLSPSGGQPWSTWKFPGVVNDWVVREPDADVGKFSFSAIGSYDNVFNANASTDPNTQPNAWSLAIVHGGNGPLTVEDDVELSKQGESIRRAPDDLFLYSSRGNVTEGWIYRDWVFWLSWETSVYRLHLNVEVSAGFEDVILSGAPGILDYSRAFGDNQSGVLWIPIYDSKTLNYTGVWEKSIFPTHEHQVLGGPGVYYTLPGDGMLSLFPMTVIPVAESYRTVLGENVSREVWANNGSTLYLFDGSNWSSVADTTREYAVSNSNIYFTDGTGVKRMNPSTKIAYFDVHSVDLSLLEKAIMRQVQIGTAGLFSGHPAIDQFFFIGMKPGSTDFQLTMATPKFPPEID